MSLNLLVGSTAVLWLAVIFNLLLTLALVRQINGTRRLRVDSGPAAGKPVADFSARTVGGALRSLRDYAQRPAIFLFVSNGCEPCAQAIPSYIELHQAGLEGGVDVVLVAGDDDRGAKELVEKFELSIPVLVAPREGNTLFADWDIQLTPTYVAFLEGKVVESGGGRKSSDQWRELVDKLAAINAGGGDRLVPSER